MTGERVRETDVLIVGAGPVGCTFARLLAEGGRSVTMIDAGAQHSARPGQHLKNAFVYQRDLDRFTPVVQGLLHPISQPADGEGRTVLDPVAFHPPASIRSAHNPRQDPAKNLEAAAVSYGVGGMFSHWTNNTPRHHPTMERINFISAEDWERLYATAESLLHTRTDVFSGSIRHQVVMEALQGHYEGRLPVERGVQALPTAGERRSDNNEFVTFTGADTILGPLIDDPEAYEGRFQILSQHRAKSLQRQGGRIHHVVVEDLMRWGRFDIRADTYVVASGAVLGPQLLWTSNIRPPALGRYLSEHPMTFAQVVLREDLVDAIRTDARFADQVSKVETEDPVPIPMHDPPPMVWIPVSEGRPWHCQVHRDSFQYGALPPDIDDRLVVDLRWFGMVEPDRANHVRFEDDLKDKFGMPRPTFEFSLGTSDRTRAHDMMSDMVEAAQVLGGFLAGAEPRFLPPGASLHLQGTHRMGPADDGTCVTDSRSKVWELDNLYLGGNGLIPTANAANPTLTSIALAIRAAEDILG